MFKGYVAVLISLICLATVYALDAPVVNDLTHDDYTISITGENFGFIKHVVNVAVDDLSHRVLAINDSIIICKRNPSHGTYSDAPLNVFVGVDGRNTTVIIDHTNKGLVDPDGPMVPATEAEAPADKSASSFSLKSNPLLSNSIVLYIGVPALVVLVAVALFLVVRKRKMATAAKSAKENVDAKAKGDVIPPTHGIMVRDTSMEEIDLNTPAAVMTTEQEGDAAHKLERSASSSSVSCSSTYSSRSNTPGNMSPDVFSSPSFARRSQHSAAREKMMSTRVGLEPVSRLGKQSLDSPYMHRQSGFDSPLASSQSMTPGLGNSGLLQQSFDSPSCSTPPVSTEDNRNALATSQEISSPHANPFDSACALHSAIQRAAIIRQSSSKPASQQPPAHLLQGRRASLGAGGLQHSKGRRGSLSTLLTSALHNSAEIARQQSLRASQHIPRPKVDEEMGTVDEEMGVSE